jgi:hypothetical protein
MPIGAAESGPKLAENWWLVRSSQVDPKILHWMAKFPQLVSVESQKTFEGHTAYAVTVTDRTIEEAGKRKLLFSQPHAHEPASTAGMMDFLSQLLDGTHLDGRPTQLPRDELLRRAVLTFIPIGNPDGRARSPEDWWDGTKYSNDELQKCAFGCEENGKCCARVGRFDVEQHRPARIGIVYERINDRVYVEPNRDTESTYFKLVHRVLARQDYALMIDLHQMQFVGDKSKQNALVLVPFSQKDLPEPIQATNRRVGEAVIEALRKAGANPVPALRSLNYGEDQIRYFRACWSGIYRSTPCVNIEVQNNGVRTPPRKQLEFIETAIQASIEAIVGTCADVHSSR